jgi:hypothetical protein
MLLALNLFRREWSDSARASQGPSGSLEAFGNCMLPVGATPLLVSKKLKGKVSIY